MKKGAESGVGANKRNPTVKMGEKRKMATISFFCTRCRRLTTFSASLRGGLVYCPNCQQALIVPDIPVVGDDEETAESGGGAARPAADERTEKNGRSWANGINKTDGINGEISGDRDAFAAEFDAAPRRCGATIASHLAPNKKRPESWRRIEREPDPVDVLDGASTPSPEVSDAEFLRRLRAEPPVPPSPPAPPILDASAFGVENASRRSGVPKAIWGTVVALALGVAFVVGWEASGKKRGDDASGVENNVAAESIFVEGALTYRTPGGSPAPDEGAFVFLFPTDGRFGAPLALGDVSPRRPDPPGFADVVAELEARGGRFATTDFEGRFAFDELEAGEYRVLLVSGRVADDFANANPSALKEIERFVVGPRLLLGENRFFWTTRRFDRSTSTFEKSFGKAGAPFANVERTAADAENFGKNEAENGRKR